MKWSYIIGICQWISTNGITKCAEINYVSFDNLLFFPGCDFQNEGPVWKLRLIVVGLYNETHVFLSTIIDDMLTSFFRQHDLCLARYYNKTQVVKVQPQMFDSSATEVKHFGIEIWPLLLSRRCKIFCGHNFDLNFYSVHSWFSIVSVCLLLRNSRKNLLALNDFIFL